MLRDIDEKLIRPEKLLRAQDMARLGCDSCRGCSYCCTNRGCEIVLDPWDTAELARGIGMTLSELLEKGLVVLSVIDGVVLPCLAVQPGTDACAFLDGDGRCSVHANRPGICRLFPLARIWHEDGSFSYFLQEGECRQPTGVKIRVDKWLGIKPLKAYEDFERGYHAELKALREICQNAETSDEERTRLQTAFLEKMFFAAKSGD